MWIFCLAWPAFVALGTWWMMGFRWDATPVGGGERFVRLTVSGPSAWLQSPLSFLGLAILLLGIVGWWLSFGRPDPRRGWMVAARYPEFALAGNLLLIMAVLCVFRLDAHVFDLGSNGIQWRAIADVRSVPNLVIAGCIAAAAVLCHVLSFGSRHRLAPRRVA